MPGSTTLNGGSIFLLQIVKNLPPKFVFSPLPVTTGRGWGWGSCTQFHHPPLNVVLPYAIVPWSFCAKFFFSSWRAVRSFSLWGGDLFSIFLCAFALMYWQWLVFIRQFPPLHPPNRQKGRQLYESISRRLCQFGSSLPDIRRIDIGGSHTGAFSRTCAISASASLIPADTK